MSGSDPEDFAPHSTTAGRPRLVGKNVVHTAWSGAFSEYRMFGEVRVPTVAEVSWHLPEGPFAYWRGRITDFRLNDKGAAGQ